jgi:hypothetical protein
LRYFDPKPGRPHRRHAADPAWVSAGRGDTDTVIAANPSRVLPVKGSDIVRLAGGA